LLLAVALVATFAALVALPARATHGARVTADEPQYLLTALSLWEDGSFDIRDELAAERWRDFHEAQLPEQTKPLDADGRRVSPHDPLLPVLLAVPVGVAGWAGAKLALAAMAGLLAAVLTWTAHRRFGVPAPTAAVVVGAFAVVPPFAAYGAQVYPELPAALAVAVGVAALTGPRPLGRRDRAVAAAAVVVLPWLSIKYLLPTAALAGLAVWRSTTPARVRLVAGFAVAGLAYLLVHRVLYDGWTAYAAGDHFVGGEHTVVGVHPDYVGRSRRLFGLLVDRHYGLAGWAPGWLLTAPALGLLARRRPPGWLALVLPLAAGWVTATWVALTMHGWWWPGRQVVVVLPLAVLAVTWWVHAAQVPVRVPVALAAAGLALWVPFVVEVLRAPFEVGLIVDLDAPANPLRRAWGQLLPDLRHAHGADWARYGAWLLAVGVAAVTSSRWSRWSRTSRSSPSSRTRKARPCSGPVPLSSVPPSASASSPVATTTAAR
jgi:hypothetical protein